METTNMLAFIEQNRVSKVIFGERRTPENKPVLQKSDLEMSDRVLHRLDDGAEFTLTNEDIKSAPYFAPDWSF